MTLVGHWLRTSIVLGLAASLASPAVAQRAYGPGVSDTEIKIGNFVPYSGPASAYGVNGKTIAAYFNKINAEGGINGRRINFITYDDAYSPPKAVEQARKLVESDEVLLLFYSLGTPSNTAIQKYMNSKKTPQLFVASGATKWNDPKGHPWTMGWSPSYQGEGHIYAQYLLEHHPNGKIGVLYQNDDYGKDYLKGLSDGLAGRMQIVAQYPYETSDPTVDSQIVGLKAAGADIFCTNFPCIECVKLLISAGIHAIYYVHGYPDLSGLRDRYLSQAGIPTHAIAWAKIQPHLSALSKG